MVNLAEVSILPYDAKSDVFAEITALLHRAYKPLADAGMNYIAAAQSEDVTRRRLAGAAIAFLAHLDGHIIGTISYYRSPPVPELPQWYSRDEVGIFAQFAVEPRFQGRGVGRLLLAHVERRAFEDGKSELACDTAVPAVELRAYYARLGFREVAFHRWKHATYESVLLSKMLGGDET